MTLREIEQRLADLGDPRAIEAVRRAGYGGRVYGVNLTKLKRLAGTLGRDRRLSRVLWQADFYEAKLLSLFVAVPTEIDRKELEGMAAEIQAPDLLWQFPKIVAVKTSYAEEAMVAWLDRSEEMVRASGYHVAAIVGADPRKGNDRLFGDILTRIKSEIATAPNWVQEAMLYALIGIGKRNDALRAKALAIYREAAPVEIDYGQTNCQPPNVENALKENTKG